MQRLGGAAAFGDVADQHENPHHLAAGQPIGHVGTQHVAFLIIDVGFGDLERHALAGQRPGHVGLQALVMLFAVHFTQALAEHHAPWPAVPFFVDLVGEFVDQVGVQIGNQRRHMVGDQANPALAFAQGFGVLVAFGDVGEGVDESARGQRMGANLQDPAIVEALFALLRGPPVGVAAGRGQQGQFAVGDHFGKRTMGRDRCQATEFEEPAVPQFQDAVGVDHRHPLGEVVHRPLQQVRLLRHRLLAAHGFAEFDVGNVGEQNHPPAFLGGPLADLQPATVLQAIQQVFVGLPARLFGEQTVVHHQTLDLGQAHAGADPHPAVAPEGLEAAVEQDDALLGIEQHEGVGDALDRVDKVLMSRFCAQARFAEQVVAGLEFGHGLVQGVGALSHLLGQHHRMLERGVGIIAPGDPGLDAFDQRGVDALQFLVVVLQAGDLRPQFSAVRGTALGQWRRR